MPRFRGCSLRWSLESERSISVVNVNLKIYSLNFPNDDRVSSLEYRKTHKINGAIFLHHQQNASAPRCTQSNPRVILLSYRRQMRPQSVIKFEIRQSNREKS